jgi:hypothetical protein
MPHEQSPPPSNDGKRAFLVHAEGQRQSLGRDGLYRLRIESVKAMSKSTATAPIADIENTTERQSWRDVLPVHPAASLFPLMGADELRELADDIKKNGLRELVAVYRDPVIGDCLLDGRNRLDAFELNDWVEGKRSHGRPSKREPVPCGFQRVGTYAKFDPYGCYVLSKNVHRRHLTAEQRRDLIAKLLKANPAASNLQIAKQTKTSDKTIGKVRAELEARSEIPNVETRTDTKCLRQPARRAAHKSKPKSPALPSKQRTTDLVPLDVEALRTAIAEVETRLVGGNIDQLKASLRALRDEIDSGLAADCIVFAPAAVLQ